MRGRTVGRYTLHDELASGGVGSVYLASASAPGGFKKLVAIKRLHAEYRRDEAFARSFLDEARLSARIAHANVVQTLDAVEADGEVLLVMEYVHGEALHRLAAAAVARGEAIPLSIASAIVVGLLHGLEAAHEARDDDGVSLDLVHRDVSPQNVIVGVDGVARLLDFGIARASGQSHVTREGHVKGKIGYMAPEQLHGEALTRRADLYACAVVLWELLTGKRLFTGETEAVAVARVVAYTVPPPSEEREGIPVAANRVVLRGLARNPELRYASAAEMARALEAAIPCAGAATVGEWVRRLAPDALVRRAEARATAERAGAPRNFGPKRLAVAALVLGALGASVVGLRIGTRSTPPSADRSMVPAGPPASALASPSASPLASSLAGPGVGAPPGVASGAAGTPSETPVASGSTSRTLGGALRAPPRAGNDAPIASPPTARHGAETPRTANGAADPSRSRECDPPWYVDSAGRKEFKRQCL